MTNIYRIALNLRKQSECIWLPLIWKLWTFAICNSKFSLSTHFNHECMKMDARTHEILNTFIFLWSKYTNGTWKVLSSWKFKQRTEPNYRHHQTFATYRTSRCKNLIRIIKQSLLLAKALFCWKLHFVRHKHTTALKFRILWADEIYKSLHSMQHYENRWWWIDVK
jgi:hypothetical protein